MSTFCPEKFSELRICEGFRKAFDTNSWHFRRKITSTIPGRGESDRLSLLKFLGSFCSALRCFQSIKHRSESHRKIKMSSVPFSWIISIYIFLWTTHLFNSQSLHQQARREVRSPEWMPTPFFSPCIQILLLPPHPTIYRSNYTWVICVCLRKLFYCCACTAVDYGTSSRYRQQVPVPLHYYRR